MQKNKQTKANQQTNSETVTFSDASQLLGVAELKTKTTLFEKFRPDIHLL